MVNLTYLTLNTGHITKAPRSAVSRHTVSLLLPIINAVGGPIPTMPGWWLDFPIGDRGERLEGGTFFQIANQPGTSKRPVVMCVAAWAERASETAWDQVRARYSPLEEPLKKFGLWKPPPAKPPPLPWLATWLAPFVVFVDVETARDLLPAFGDLERCVAWAMIP